MEGSKSSNVVNVVAIDEERLKFRVNIALINRQARDGVFQVELPIPTFFGNSNQYNSALIKCTGFGALCPGNIADPVWSIGQPAGARVFSKMSCIEIQLDVPSSQTTAITNGGAIAGAVPADILGQSRIGGFRQLMFLKVVNAGDAAGNFDFSAVGGGACACWLGESNSEPLLCGNPFGSVLTITHKFPTNDETCKLVSQAVGAAGPDLGEYCYTFDITMVPNK